MGSTPAGGHRRARTRVTLLAAPLAALLAAAACGGPADGASPEAVPSSAATSAAPVPGAPTASGAAPAPGAPSGSSGVPGRPSADQLREALLTADDLGPAFLQPEDTGQSGSSTTSGCPALGDLLGGGGDGPGRVQVETELTTTAATPYVGESLTTEDEAALQSEFGRAVQALTTCRSVTFTSPDSSVTFALTPTGLGGPGTSAVRMDGDLDGTPVNGYLAVQRIGPAFLTYWYLQVDSASSQLAADFYQQASDKAAHFLTGAPASPTGDAAGQAV
ncbi:hypothetical protein [Kitasatospora sp. NPDC059571]|uniref:hypothetical protein n=1 Tax=Kitasatospora sp. NPDC059571 TaxID=3346871 RepID=UPI0036D020AB